MKKSETCDKTVPVMARLRLPVRDHLAQKAAKNPENKHNFVATELIALAESDFEAMQKKKKRTQNKV